MPPSVVAQRRALPDTLASGFAGWQGCCCVNCHAGTIRRRDARHPHRTGPLGNEAAEDFEAGRFTRWRDSLALGSISVGSGARRQTVPAAQGWMEVDIVDQPSTAQVL